MRVFKLLLSALYYLVISASRIILKLFGTKLKPICVTLYYHSIYDDEIDSFKKQIDLIKRKSNVLKSDHFGELDSTKIYTILTFDDAFENVFLNAIPILKENNIPFTIFFISDYFGRKPDWEIPEWNKDANEKIMTIDQTKVIPKSLLTIGSHTKTHKKLTLLNEKDLIFELSESKLSLENIFEQSVKVLSFPNGEYNSKIIEQSFNAGYERVYTIDPKLSLLTPNERISGRVWTNGNDWYPEFWLKVHGAYSWLDTAFRIKRRIFSKSQ